MRSRKAMKRISVAAVFGLAACSAVSILAAEPDTGGLDVVRVRPNFYMIAGDGGNIAVQIGSDGAGVVDAGSGRATDQVVAAIKKITELPIRFIINTGADADAVGGHGKLAQAGTPICTN